jgi:hypothetical protein
MVDQAQIVIISISGSVDDHQQSWKSILRRRAADQKEETDPGKTPPEHPEKETIEGLNKMSGDICMEIERQIKKIVGPDVAVQVEMSFSSGSIVIAGTVILLSWSGNLVLDAMKKEIAELVRIPIKRVLAEVLAGLGGNASRLEIETAVRSQSVAHASTTETPVRETTAPVVQLPTWMNVAFAVIALSILFLAADRLASDWPSRASPPVAHGPAT